MGKFCKDTVIQTVLEYIHENFPIYFMYNDDLALLPKSDIDGTHGEN